MSSRLKNAMGAFLRAILGRKGLVRLGRFLSNQGRLDLSNDLLSNGESLVQACALRASGSSGKFICLDVGANVGAWIKSLMSANQGPRLKCAVHAFEPCPGTARTLVENLRAWGLESDVVCNGCALSSKGGSGRLLSTGDNEGRNGLYPLAGVGNQSAIEVPLDTVDGYCARQRIDRVNLIKIDTEGHDFEVILGAAEMLKKGAVDLLQFEYNARWIDARRYLKDAFEFLAPLGYQLGKVTPFGVEWYPSWHCELETFREANFVAATPGLRGVLPPVQWWYSSARE